MSNVTEYRDIMAFHPGYYIADLIEDLDISQEEFAVRLGTTPKTVSLLVNGQCDISKNIAEKLAKMLGSTVEVWLNLQLQYDAQIAKINIEKDFAEQEEIASMLDYSFFTKLGLVEKTGNMKEKVANLCKLLKVSNLQILLKQDYLANYRTGISKVDKKNIISAKAWLQTAINISQTIHTNKFDAKKLNNFLPELRSMTSESPEVFMPRLRKIFSECGIKFVMLPSLKNAGINGAVKWSNSGEVLLALNNRRIYGDVFWFSLFHEIKHVLQEKRKRVFLTMESETIKNLDDKLEEDADRFSSNYLIPKDDYMRFTNANEGLFCESMIRAFAAKLEIHPGILVGRLQHDGYIPYNKYVSLKCKYDFSKEYKIPC